MESDKTRNQTVQRHCEVSKFQLVICNKGWFSQAVVSVQRPSFQILSCNLKGAGHSVPFLMLKNVKNNSKQQYLQGPGGPSYYSKRVWESRDQGLQPPDNSNLIQFKQVIYYSNKNGPYSSLKWGKIALETFSLFSRGRHSRQVHIFIINNVFA